MTADLQIIPESTAETVTSESSTTRRRVSPHKNRSGQSTIEFALTLILFLSFFLFYSQMGMIFAFGNYVHYATFMSARAFLAAGQNSADQRTRARDVIVKMLKKSVGQSGTDKFPSIAVGVGGGDPGGFEIKSPREDEPLSWMAGVRYTFQGRLFMLPLSGSKKNQNTGPVSPGQKSANTLLLKSESWLGREPTEDECSTVMRGKGWIFDNGC